MNDPHGGYSAQGDTMPWSGQLRVCPLREGAGLEVAGEVCLPTLAVWEGALEQAIRQHQGAYRLELSKLTFIDMAGATALAMAALSLDNERRFVVTSPPPALSRLLELFWPDLSAIEVGA
ncbi:STAS domain-containing protein [Streptomyces sp. NPDC055189]